MQRAIDSNEGSKFDQSKEYRNERAKYSQHKGDNVVKYTNFALAITNQGSISNEINTYKAPGVTQTNSVFNNTSTVSANNIEFDGLDKNKGDNYGISPKDFGLNNAYSFGLDEKGNKKFVITRKTYPKFDNSIALSKEGLIIGVKSINNASMVVSMAAAIDQDYPLAVISGLTALTTEGILLVVDDKKGVEVIRESSISVIKAPGIKGEIAAQLLIKTINFLEKKDKE